MRPIPGRIPAFFSRERGRWNIRLLAMAAPPFTVTVLGISLERPFCL